MFGCFVPILTEYTFCHFQTFIWDRSSQSAPGAYGGYLFSGLWSMNSGEFCPNNFHDLHLPFEFWKIFRSVRLKLAYHDTLHTFYIRKVRFLASCHRMWNRWGVIHHSQLDLRTSLSLMLILILFSVLGFTLQWWLFETHKISWNTFVIFFLQNCCSLFFK